MKLESGTKDFTEIIMIVLKENNKSTNCSANHPISRIAHTANIVAKILRKIARRVEDVIGEEQFECRREKGTGGAIWMLRMISERALDIDEELRSCFLNWQKAFDHVS
jgi:hypothetical protein